MLDSFITSFVLMLAQEDIVNNVKISNDIIKYLIDSEDDFSAIELRYDDIAWILRLNNKPKSEELTVKIINVADFI